MAEKTIHSPSNAIFLTSLRQLRESRGLRQADLAKLLGRSQATVSNVERGERRLDVIELRDWLAALEFDFIAFVSDLDAELRRVALPLHRHTVTGAGQSAIHALGGVLRAPK